MSVIVSVITLQGHKYSWTSRLQIAYSWTLLHWQTWGLSFWTWYAKCTKGTQTQIHLLKINEIRLMQTSHWITLISGLMGKITSGCPYNHVSGCAITEEYSYLRLLTVSIQIVQSSPMILKLLIPKLLIYGDNFCSPQGHRLCAHWLITAASCSLWSKFYWTIGRVFILSVLQMMDGATNTRNVHSDTILQMNKGSLPKESFALIWNYCMLHSKVLNT